MAVSASSNASKIRVKKRIDPCLLLPFNVTPSDAVVVVVVIVIVVDGDCSHETMLSRLQDDTTARPTLLFVDTEESSARRCFENVVHAIAS